MLKSTPSRSLCSIFTVAALSIASAFVECRAAELYVGGATVSITPDRPVALAGQMHTRIARNVESLGDGNGAGPGIPGRRQGRRSGDAGLL